MITPAPAMDWWYEAFPLAPYGRKPPGEKEMLIILAYDIADPKRLSRVARLCEDYGMRVQYSIFECRLEEHEIRELWSLLEAEIEPDEDRIVAYRLDARCARETLTAGTMACSEKAVCYLV